MSPLVRRVTARNSGPFTYHGTGTYLVGRGKVAVIDPGPDDDAHIAAIMAATSHETITHILVTHTHLDHSPGAAPLKRLTGAPTYGFGPHGGIASDDDVRVEEGGDMNFTPDHAIVDGDAIRGAGFTFTALHTPGHTSNHLCFAFEEECALFTGDHVMGWSTTVVVPPDGDMEKYYTSLERLLSRNDQIYYPTHGGPIGDPIGGHADRHAPDLQNRDPQNRNPQNFVRALIAHRRAREDQLLAVLAKAPAGIPAMVAEIYTDVEKRLHAAAAQSVFAHLIAMVRDGRVTTTGLPARSSIFRLP